LDIDSLGMLALNANNLNVSNCLFVGPGGMGAGVQTNAAPGQTFSDNGFAGWGTGLFFDGDGALEFPGGSVTGCAFGNNQSGLYLEFVDGTQTITGNGFTVAIFHLETLLNNGVTVSASGNDFKSGGGIVVATNDGTLNAQGNFWGVGTTPPSSPGQFNSTGSATIDVSNPLLADPFPGF
ncbi:MAG: hypothetical protein KC800_21775, partial [Candidatus Eremiobacteraeota bacterium]|nr:hypothetical protein [Candidatus Eremiobacteraeota bacterium]